ncbi:MAG: M28 family peptidase [Robiginitalea sp.]
MKAIWPVMLLTGVLFIVSSCGSLRNANDASGEAKTASDKSTVESKNEEASEFSDTGILSEHMQFLASDELKGRDTGSEGIEAAAAFLEGKLAEYGIRPYFGSYRDTLTNSKAVAYNIVGVLEGSDPDLKEQYILIGAHYDHIGVVPLKNGDGIANGANDNASGTVTVLELARYFGANTPGRSMIFAFFSAEERGLLGSRHLARVLNEGGLDLYAMLNFEMTGVPMNGRKYLTYLTGYDKSNLAEVCNAYGGADLIGYLPTARDYNLYERSDNYAFYQEFKVPSHTFSTFDFENYNYYHQPGDEFSRMDFTHMALLVNRMIPAIQGIANTGEREITAN